MELRKTLANGIEVIANTNPHLHSFCATVWIRAGSAYEQAAEHGITHLMEHCIVRGLKAYFQEDYYTLLSRHGIKFDAYTSQTATQYILGGVPAGIPMAAEMLRKMFLPVRLSTEEFRMEKGRIRAEMSGSYPWKPADVIWEQSPLNRPIYGSLSKLERFSRVRVNGYMQSVLVPGNVRLCLTGCIGDEDLALLLEAAEMIPMYAGPAAPRELPRPRHYGERWGIFNRRAESDYLRFVFDADPGENSWAAIGLLRAILLGGLDGTLYQHLSERTGLVYGFESPYKAYRNCCSLEFSFSYDPARLRPTLQAVWRAVDQVEQGFFDLEGKKRALRAQWEVLQDDPGELNAAMQYYLELTDFPEPPDHEAVTKDELLACARRTFNSGLMLILHSRPWEEIHSIVERPFASEP